MPRNDPAAAGLDPGDVDDHRVVFRGVAKVKACRRFFFVFFPSLHWEQVAEQGLQHSPIKEVGIGL